MRLLGVAPSDSPFLLLDDRRDLPRMATIYQSGARRIHIMIEDYTLEIYSPGSMDTTLTSVESATPFMSIHAGDFISPRALGVSKYVEQGHTLRVTTVHHLISQVADRTLRKLCVYTEEVPLTHELLTGVMS